jgi:glycerophosphoryl diester phosphodiesterase
VFHCRYKIKVLSGHLYFFLTALILQASLANAQSLKEQLTKGNVVLCAHRGGMYADHAENSLRALDFLVKSFGSMPVMAEVDIRKSKDGTLFLLHDNTLERTTTGVGKIEEATDKYLQTLTLRNGNGEVTGEKIPTFADLLDFVAGKNIFLMLDVKIDDWEQILGLVRSKNAMSRCLVLTFKPENSKKVHELSPGILVSCLVGDQKDWEEISKLISRDVLLAYINKSTPDDVVKTMKQKNIPLVTDASEATTNNFKPYAAEFYKSVINRGVNVYVTDLPLEVHALIHN